mgnify:CR=1 FL=1
MPMMLSAFLKQKRTKLLIEINNFKFYFAYFTPHNQIYVKCFLIFLGKVLLEFYFFHNFRFYLVHRFLNLLARLRVDI